MELHELGRRLIGQHWRLIWFFLLLGAGLAAVVHSGGERTYTASARLVLDTQDPKTRAESIAIADTASAIATSPAQVEGALRDAHVAGRDSVEISRNHVSLRGLGTSGVLELSVSDRDPAVARAVSNALAARVIRTRQDLSSGRIEQALTRLERQIESTNRKIVAADAVVDDLNAQADTGSTSSGSSDLLKRNAATRLRDFLAQQRGVLESERVNLLSTTALRPKPQIISPAPLPRHRDPSRLLPDVILGSLLGLLLGVGLAGLLETTRPTVVGGDALAREFATPLLGTFPRDPDGDDARRDLTHVAARLRHAAEALDVEQIGLVGVVEEIDVRHLAEWLERAQVGLNSVSAEADAARLAQAAEAAAGGSFQREVRPVGTSSTAARASRPTRLLIQPFSLETGSLSPSTRAGLVLVSPSSVKRADLADVSHFLMVTPLRLLGLLVYDPARSRKRRGTGDVVDAGSSSTLAR